MKQCQETTVYTTNFLRNAWYIAAWDSEVDQDALFARTLLGDAGAVRARRMLDKLIADERAALSAESAWRTAQEDKAQ